MNTNEVTTNRMAIIGLAGLIIVGLLSVAKAPQAPPSAPVTVVNTTANPVPVVQQGALTINGTPNVNVANTAASPAIVRDTDNPASEPVTLTINQAMPNDANTLFVDLYTVPANKRLVIEYIHAHSALPVGDQCNIHVVFGSHLLELPFARLTTNNLIQDPPENWFAHLTVRLYVNSGEHVIANFVDAPAFTSQLRTAELVISGYLVTN